MIYRCTRVDTIAIAAAINGTPPKWLTHCERVAAVEHLRATTDMSLVKIAAHIGRHPRLIERDSAELRERNHR